MHEKNWEWTLLDELHSPLESRIEYGDDEHVIVSFFASNRDWTVYTTHRLIGECDGRRAEILQPKFGSTGFGDFKGDLDAPRIEPAKIRIGLRTRPFLYETGYASMAPIHYFKFWSLKWPIWKETYQLSIQNPHPLAS